MKKRILSILLAVCMTVCFVPTQSVYAESKSTAQSVARQSTCPPHNYNTDKGICKTCNYQCPHTAGWDAATCKCNECKMKHRCISYVDNISIDTGICGTCGHLWAARFHKGTAKYLYKEDSIINKCISNDIKGDWKNDAFLYIYVNVSDTLSFGNKGPIVLTSPDTVTINEIVIENGSEITLNGGVFNKVTVKSGGKLTVNGGTIKNLTKETGSAVIGNAIREVSDTKALNDAFADSTVGTVKLKNDISIDSYIQVRRAVTLDLNGYVLGLSRNKSIIVNNNSSASKLTLTDSNPNAVHKFTPDSNGVWALDETNGTKTVKGGVITGGNSNGNSDCGGAMSVGLNGTVIMEAGNIIGCQANGDGGAMTESDEVLHKLNTPIAKPDDPDKTGYTFGGWYTDAACIQAWNFDDWVTEELTLYAGWTVNQYTVVIKPENGDDDIVITQDYGTQITAPSLTKDGYTFIGWDMDFPVAMPAEDITITAQWKKTEKPTVKPEEKAEQKTDTKVNNIKKAQTKSPETGSSALAVSALSITAGIFILGRKKRKK